MVDERAVDEAGHGPDDRESFVDEGRESEVLPVAPTVTVEDRPAVTGDERGLMPGEEAVTGGKIHILKQERAMWFYAGVLQDATIETSPSAP